MYHDGWYQISKIYFQLAEVFAGEFGLEISSGVHHIVQFSKNISCFMNLKNDQNPFGESDQLNLLKKGTENP